MKKLQSLYNKAYSLMLRVHAGQFRRDGVTPYYMHPVAVADYFELSFEKIVAILHDTIEDSDDPQRTKEEIRAEFPDEVYEAVVAITKLPNEPLVDYWARVRANDIAKKVKVKDMLVNLADDPTPRQIEKYLRGLDFLLLPQLRDPICFMLDGAWEGRGVVQSRDRQRVNVKLTEPVKDFKKGQNIIVFLEELKEQKSP